ncbi:uncharacterized protein LOC123216811 isoform X1 [Mangifera indica]|uniref:uncharacterized protein LOC123216811 isoform X1 n=2 Tax=Mangifera indica TaxID=29780 RepID=UPI001CFAB07F|nr:uncharacterized protein LOC123216811 isoform X1 [Mangifera indica]XP_044493327.1 uncharacterized protein LOC123216811 isoform X1 [Mangifera indica]
MQNNWRMNDDKLKALQEKCVAQSMMLNEEYVSAREKLLIAQQLCPTLDYIDSMLNVCDILILAAGFELSDCEIDDFCVHHLFMPSVTHSDTVFQYQKLLTSLQVIKDEFPGTELAIQFLQNAFSNLSDRGKRSEYYFQQDASLAGQLTFKCHTVSSSEILGTGSIEGVSMEVTSEKSGNHEPCVLPYHDVDEQDDIITHQASLALPRLNQEFYNFENDRKVEFLRAGQIWATYYQASVPYRYALVNSNNNFDLIVTWLKPKIGSSNEKTWYFSGLPVGCGTFDLSPERNDVVRPMVFSHQCSPFHSLTENQFEIYPKKGEIWAVYENWNPDECAYNPKCLKECKFHLVEMLSDFSKFSGADIVYLMKRDGFRSVFERQTIELRPTVCQIPSNNLYSFSHNIPAYRIMGGDGKAVFELDQLALPDGMVVATDTQIILKKRNINVSTHFTPQKQLPSLGSYPDSKTLKHKWSPNDFCAGQVWSVFCAKDSMPRQYIQINGVISEKQVSVTLLEPLPVLRHDIEWKKKNLPIVCGLFELCKTSVILEPSYVSILIEPQRSLPKPYFIIYPKKGEVWAMYKNWNNEWNQNDYRNCEYFVVEILSELFNEDGMRIAKLVKVENYATFFQRQRDNGFDIVRTVLQAEMLSFSHRIPAFKVPEISQYGVSEDSWHLDPNALPSNS